MNKFEQVAGCGLGVPIWWGQGGEGRFPKSSVNKFEQVSSGYIGHPPRHTD